MDFILYIRCVYDSYILVHVMECYMLCNGVHVMEWYMLCSGVHVM